MQKQELHEKDPSTDTTDESPREQCFSPSPVKRRTERMADEKYAQKKEKRRVILSTIRNKVKIKDIMRYVIEQDLETGDCKLFSDVYKIKGLLGVGGFGVVLAVENKETQNL